MYRLQVTQVFGDEVLALKVTPEVSVDESSSSTLTQSIIYFYEPLPYTQRHCHHVRIEKAPVQTVAINDNYHYSILTLRFVLMEITKVVKPVH